MTDLTQLVKPGDGFCVKTGTGTVPKAIAVMEALTGHAGAGNHIASFHNWRDGIPHGFEGRPSGYGPVDMRRYFADKHQINNIGQKKSPSQRQILVQGMDYLYRNKTDYDWGAIVVDGLRAFGIDFPRLFQANWHGVGYPGQAICSSAYAVLAYKAKLEPIPDVSTMTDEFEEIRYIDPMEWGDLWEDNNWSVSLR